MPQTLRVECPRCKRIWTAHEGQSEIDCNCHLYCQYGEKPSDCTLVADTSGLDPFNGNWKWPSGLHNSEIHEGDNTQGRIYYCSTHSVYTNKLPILIPVDWSKQPLKKKLRMSHGNY